MRILASPFVMVPAAALFALDLPPTIDRWSAVAPFPAPATSRHAALFGENFVSHDARRLANLVAEAGDNAHSAFAIVDKKLATIHVFDKDARLRASSLILLGSAPGDDAVPAASPRELAGLRPHERTTPAGRFVAERGGTLGDGEVFWVSYENRLAIHPVFSTNPAERELERAATPRPGEARKSYGCINVPAAFFKEVLRPVFAQGAVIYILPEAKRLEQVFRFDQAIA